LIVSHDRYFLNKLCDHLFVFEGEGEIRDFPGNYRQYREAKEQEEAEKEKPAVVKEKKDTRVVQRSSKKLSYREQQEWDGIEEEIERLETQKSELEEKINSGITDYEEIMALSEKLETVSAELDHKTERWMELSERLEG